MAKLVSIGLYVLAVASALLGHTIAAALCNNTAVAIGSNRDDENE